MVQKGNFLLFFKKEITRFINKGNKQMGANVENTKD